MANISIGTNAGMGRCSSIPIQEDPHPHWNTATTTPYAAPTESRLSTAALVAITTDRNATVSRTNDSATTVRISHGIRAAIRPAKSTVPAVVPTREVRAARSGSTEGRSRSTRSVVACAWGALVGTTLRTAVSPAGSTFGA